MLFKAAGMAQVRRDDATTERDFLCAKFNDKALLMPVTNSYLHQQGQSLLKYDYSITIGIPPPPKEICYPKLLASHTFDGNQRSRPQGVIPNPVEPAPLFAHLKNISVRTGFTKPVERAPLFAHLKNISVKTGVYIHRMRQHVATI